MSNFLFNEKKNIGKILAYLRFLTTSLVLNNWDLVASIEFSLISTRKEITSQTGVVLILFFFSFFFFEKKVHKASFPG